MHITGKTRITGLFGYPVEHSLSPLMHNAAFARLGMDWCYLPFCVRPDALHQAVAAVRALSMAGVNVTVPHKEAVIPLLDAVDEEASFIGAVNTIVHRDNMLHGYNTDGRGFMRSLSEAEIPVDGKRILIAGSGGASRAVSYYLSEKAGAVSLFDIDTAKSAKLSSDLGKIRGNITNTERIDNLSDYDIIVNATPLGLKQSDPLPIDTFLLSPHHIICDLIYHETRLLAEASARGCVTVNGLGMLLWQGVLAFELWTNVSPPVDDMRNALLTGLG